MHKKPHILVIDDCRSNRHHLLKALTKLEYNMIEASNGLEALKKLKRHKVDLILLDLMMPVMDGQEFLKHFGTLSISSNIPIIVITTETKQEEVLYCLRMGSEDFINKPFQTSVLKAKISNSLYKKQRFDKEKKCHDNTKRELAKKDSELREVVSAIGSLERAKKTFLTQASHEMRTPLNGISIVEQLFEDNEPANKRSIVSAYKKSFNRLLTLIEESCLLLDIEVNGTSLLSDNLLLENIINKSSQKFIDRKKIRAVLQDVPNLQIPGDENLLVQAFEAILRISCALCKQNEIVIAGKQNEQEKFVYFILNGVDLSQSQLLSFWQMFGTNKEGSNIGLGLGPVVAHDLVKACGGITKIYPKEDDSGVVIELAFPQKKES
ncbi:MAG: hybrid sensor histidine kinase/response regulator [Lentisphaeraceae bacterium]|nr:hybrid sensor histidine kinase/response regulator [Lentisphaeraceae bacterium]